MQKLIVFKWEKIHRLIRDIKGPIGKSCGGVFLKSQVYSSYVWNLGQKPFGSGFWGTVLERALDVFAHCNTIDSARFQKYLPQLATEFSMPSTTRDEQQCILDSVVALESFRTRGAECKLGRWFSWNGAARANLNQFSAQKMVIEDYLDGPGSGLVDPDNEATAFDDLNAAAGARTPHAQLQKLRESGGGLQLAYKMMATTMRNLDLHTVHRDANMVELVHGGNHNEQNTTPCSFVRRVHGDGLDHVASCCSSFRAFPVS